MTVCMHWRYRYDLTPTTITKTCLDCGAIGGRPRCIDKRHGGAQCRAHAIDDSVRCDRHQRARHGVQ